MRMPLRPVLALTASAVLLAASAPAASAAGNTLTIKVPRCSKSSTAIISVTARPTSTSVVVALAAFLNAPPAQPGSKLLFAKTYVVFAANGAALPLGVSRTVRVRVPVGRKIYAVTDFAVTGGGESKSASSAGVKRCPRPKPKFTG